MIKLKTLRELGSITQKQLAQKLGVKQSTVAMWETGKAFPKYNNLLKLSKVFNCGAEDLINFESK